MKTRGNRNPATKQARLYHDAFLKYHPHKGLDQTSDAIVKSKEYREIKKSERKGISFREAGRELGISLDNFRESTRINEEGL